MKSILAILAIFGLVAAQSTGNLPTCAQNCVTKFTTGSNIGGCPQLDAECICASDTFISGIACCLADVCSQADQEKTIQFAVSFCATQGVQVPTAVSCASTSTSMTTSGTTVIAGNATVSVTSTGTVTGTAAVSPTTSASQNVGPQVGAGSGAVGIFGGLLAALAML